MTNNSKQIEYFDTLSNSYEKNEYASFFTTNYMRRKLIKKVRSFDGKSVLDLMSGKGENLKYINSNSNTNITTLDFSSKMNVAARLNHTNKITQQIERDFFKTEFRTNAYDIILCSFGIKTIEKNMYHIFSKKMSQSLKPNGEILLLEMVRPKHYLTSTITKLYLRKIIPVLVGKQFKPLFPYVKNHKNMDELKRHLIIENLKIIEHTRFFDLFEIIHAKKI